MADWDLARIYGVETKRLNEQVNRNIRRFPDDFMFILSREEAVSLRSQIATLEGKGRHRKFAVRVFTELGVAMLSSVLRSDRAIDANIAIMRAFVRYREERAVIREVAGQIGELRGRVDEHEGQIGLLFDSLRHLRAPRKRSRKRIGFVP